MNTSYAYSSPNVAKKHQSTAKKNIFSDSGETKIVRKVEKVCSHRPFKICFNNLISNIKARFTLKNRRVEKAPDRAFPTERHQLAEYVSEFFYEIEYIRSSTESLEIFD